MTSIGTHWSDTKTGTGGQEVLWLTDSAPPPALVTFLRSRGLALVTRENVRSRSPLKLRPIEPSTSPSTRAPMLHGRRVAVLHPDPGNADALAQALRAKGAEVVALSLNPESLERAEMLDPDAVVIEANDFCGSCWEIVRAIFQHPRLRFATLLLATPELMGSQPVSALDVHDLSFVLSDSAEEYERVAEEAGRLERFSFELASLGPSRALRALLESSRKLRVSLGAGADSIEIDLAEHIIVGAQSPAGAAPGEGLLGVHALQLFLAQREGRVEVRTVEHPAHTNVMAPLDAALHAARDASSGARPSGVHRPVFHSTAPGQPAERAKSLGSSQRTLIGVPAVKLDASGAAVLQTSPPAQARSASPAKSASKTLLGIATVNTKEPQRPSAPALAAKEPQRPSAPALAAKEPQRPSAPALSAKEPQRPSAPELAPTLPPPASDETQLPAGERSLASVPAPAGPARPNKPPALPSAPPPLVKRGEASEPTPRSKPPRPSAAAYEPTMKLEQVDAEAIKAMRPGLPASSARYARWGAGALVLVVAALIVVARPSRRQETATTPVPELPVASLGSKALAEAPPLEAAPVQPVNAAEASVEEADEIDVGHQTRGNARRASALSNQGNSFRRKKMLPSARARYLEALRVYPDYPRALAGLVSLSLASGQNADARDYARQLVKARPGQAAYHLLLGDAYRAAGDAEEARAAYQTAARLGSRSARERLAK